MGDVFAFFWLAYGVGMAVALIFGEILMAFGHDKKDDYLMTQIRWVIERRRRRDAAHNR